MGKSAQIGAPVAVAEVNAAGGFLGRSLALVVRDDQADNDVGRKAAQDIVLNEKVAAAFGFAARLSEMESRSRWQGVVADDEAAPCTASF